LLKRGFDKVEAVFVRVEQSDPDNPSEPQCVVYGFDASELPVLETSIVGRYNSDSA